MKFTRVMICAFILGALDGCNDNSVLPTESQIVVQAYLYENEPVTEIYVGRSLSIGSTDTTNEAIVNATVVLGKDGTSYALATTPGRTGFYSYTGSDLVVRAGDRFQLQIVADGKTVSAETTVPPGPVSVAVSEPMITFTTVSVTTPRGTMTRVAMSDTALITWSNPSGELYYVTVKSTDPNRTAISTDTLTMPIRMFTTRPSAQANYRLNESQLTYTGAYTATVYRVNKEYSDLYRSRESDSRDLNEPLTNINNGLGVFSAFASDTVTFVVVKK